MSNSITFDQNLLGHRNNGTLRETIASMTNIGRTSANEVLTVLTSPDGTDRFACFVDLRRLSWKRPIVEFVMTIKTEVALLPHWLEGTRSFTAVLDMFDGNNGANSITPLELEVPIAA